MSPVLMILASLLGVSVLGGVFGLQQVLRRRRAARRRSLRASGRLGPVDLPAREALAKRGAAE